MANHGDADGRTELRYEDAVEFLEKFLEGQDMRAEKILDEVVKNAKDVWPRLDWDSALLHAKSER